MTDLTRLQQLKELGEQYRCNPLSTYSDDTLIKEVERRGHSVLKKFDFDDVKFDFDMAAIDADLLKMGW
jgi:hypothetical protein